jgi:hypothetical protein
MTAATNLRTGFLNSTIPASTPWTRLTHDARRRLIGRGRPFTTMFSFKPFSDLYDFCAFVSTHKRIPNFRRTRYINDYLFHVKWTGENLALRRRTSDKDRSISASSPTSSATRVHFQPVSSERRFLGAS